MPEWLVAELSKKPTAAEMVAQSALSRSDAIAIAVEAASRSGLSRSEALRTTQSAFQNQFRGRK
jgi:hypothetical protein